MFELEVSRIPEILDAAPTCINVMLVADSGIGKTTQVERYCKERGLYLKTLILSQLEASETLGIPVQAEREWNGVKYPVLKTALPEWLFDLAEHQDGQDPEYPNGAVLFLDEFLCAQPSVMNAFLNFLTQKRVGNIDLSRVKIIAATNVGNYTFDPDINMLARFCWFYVINTTMNEWLNDKRIINSYHDETERQGVLFDVRSLKPRCQEWLMQVDDDHLQMFYEGFTNQKYVRIHMDGEINDTISIYFDPIKTTQFSITDDNIKIAVTLLVKTFTRFRKWSRVMDNFINIDLETRSKLKKALEDAVGDAW